MDIKELEARMHAFVAGKGWYELDSPKPQTARNLAISLSLEAAEVLEHFQWRSHPRSGEDQAALASELADVGLYLLQLASVCEIDLEQAILDKLETNESRDWPAP